MSLSGDGLCKARVVCHGFNEYDDRQSHLAHCTYLRRGESEEYNFEFPVPGYETDKVNFRFVAGGVIPPEQSLSDDQVALIRAKFPEGVVNKPLLESQDGNNQLTLDRVVSAVVQGSVNAVRRSLESSPYLQDTILLGVEPWDAPPSHQISNEWEEEEVPLLLSSAKTGADVNAANLDGRTSLMEAALWGRLENVEVLLSRLRQIFEREYQGTTI
ncbi:hypothetical protein FGRMN_7039 [Fusarium graminum]|nr:hypothetical protein FGRMN_7039 [Fusarium graminum]